MKKDVKWSLVSSFLAVNVGILYIIALVGKENFSDFKFWHFAGLILFGAVWFLVDRKLSLLKERKFQARMNAGTMELALLNMYAYFVLWSIGMCTPHKLFVMLCFWIGAILLTVLLTYIIPQKFFDKLESKDKPEDA